MKCAAWLYQLGGGAPRSVLEYLRLLKARGDRVTVLARADEDSVLSLYRETVDQVILRSTFKHLWDAHRYGAAFGELRFARRLILREKPDLVLAVGEVNGFFLSDLCRRLAVPLIILIAGGDLSKNGFLAKGWDGGRVVCFSEENQAVIRAHRPDIPVHVIPNRIRTGPAFADAEAHYRNVRDVHILIVSRIVPDKLRSVLRFLEELAACGHRQSLRVRIAGGGESLPLLREKIAERFDPLLDIQLLGHVDDLTPHFAWAHLAAGKGRSVIEPLMLGRIGCVLTEEGPACVCSEESLEALARTNFSGRSIEAPQEKDRACAVIEGLLKGTIDLSAQARCAEKVRRRYAAEYLPEKWEDVLRQCRAVPPGSKQRRAHLLRRYGQFIWRKAKNKLGR